MSSVRRLTTRAPEYKTCSCCYIVFNIIEKKLGNSSDYKDFFKMLTELIKQNKGYISYYNGNKKWKIFSRKVINSRDIRDHLDWFYEEIKPYKKVLHLMKKDKGFEIYLNVCWLGYDGGPVLFPEQLHRIGELQLNLSFFIKYFLLKETENDNE